MDQKKVKVQEPSSVRDQKMTDKYKTMAVHKTTNQTHLRKSIKARPCWLLQVILHATTK